MKPKIFFLILFLTAFLIELNAHGAENEPVVNEVAVEADSMVPSDTDIKSETKVVKNKDEEKKNSGRTFLFIMILIALSLAFIGYRYMKYKE